MAQPTPSDLAAEKTAAACELALMFSVLPLVPGTKRPMLNDWVSRASSRRDEIEAWFSSEPAAGIGIRTGRLANGAGFFVLDVDEHDPAKSGGAALGALEEAHGELPPTIEVATANGGRHLYFSVPSGAPTPRNDAGRRLGPGLDIRGEGGQVVAPPTTLAVGSYRWASSPAVTAMADAPAWLMELLADPAPVAEPPLIKSSATGPADWFSQQAHWPALLASAGWHLDARGHVTRPGKDPRAGTSGVLHPESGVLVVFTTELSPDLERTGVRTADGSGLSFTPFRFIAATAHAGDLSAAAREVRSMMPSSVAPSTADGLLEPLSIDNAEAIETSRGWEPIDLSTMSAADLVAPTPDVLARTDLVCLLRSGKLNMLLGRPGCGKTWIALMGIAQEIQAGRKALLIDHEDCIQTAWLRLSTCYR